MPTVTGNLKDVGLGHLVGLQPEVQFTLNAPNVSGASVFATRPASVTVPSSGDFTITLADTTSMRDQAWYTLRVRWLEPGRPGDTGYTAIDLHGMELAVGPSGGAIGDLVGGLPTNLRFIYVSMDPPTFALPFMLWLKQDPDDPMNPQNTGNLYEWRNA